MTVPYFYIFSYLMRWSAWRGRRGSSLGCVELELELDGCSRPIHPELATDLQRFSTLLQLAVCEMVAAARSCQSAMG